MSFGAFLLWGLLLVVPIICAPLNDDQTLVVSSTAPSSGSQGDKEGKAHAIPAVPQIYQMRIRSDIRNRFANTTITSRVRNYGSKAQEAVFSVVLPEQAFISGFVMEIAGKNYTAYVKEKEEAKRIYDEAVMSGIGAAHVAVSARDSNTFSVSLNVEAEAKASFYLTYEQLLERQDSRYEQIINIHPGQPVKDLSVEVVISESRKILDLKAPPLRSGNEIGAEKSELDPRADIEIVNDTSAIVRFAPNIERQKELAHVFGSDVEKGLAGQFVVQYDVERDPKGGEVLIQDGYFVHFFAPSDLKPLPKQVVFVLDTSGSMWGQKIEQLREAMDKILGQLNEHDSLNLVEFNSNTKVWDLNDDNSSVWYPRTNDYYLHDATPEVKLEEVDFPPAYPANADNIKKAKAAVAKLVSDGSTGMFGALEVALHLVEMGRKQNDSLKRQPMVIFLTDGEPTDKSTSEIISKISELNSGPRRAPIFALAFGDGADKDFLQNFALRNKGFSRQIYEASDASLQLQHFYREISSPLLSGVTFKYEESVTSLTTTDFPIHFGGREIVVAGWCGTDLLTPIVDGFGINGEISLKPTVTRSVSNVERLWAYLKIKQLLEQKEISEVPEEIKKKALDLALKYSFVTSVSSLVVVKPNHTDTVNAQEAKPYADFDEDGSIGLRISGNYASLSKAGRPMLALSAVPYSNRFGSYDDEVWEESEPVRTTTIPESGDESPLTTFPWLNEILHDDLIKTANGTYKVGANETITDEVKCSKSLTNLEGHCTLLHACPQAPLLLTSAQDFLDHFCVLKNEFAGVCCPNDP
uniref:Inter-alpha-trypsin inhibitor heavy chain H4 n=1 Tax=Photinus pyralis TaxID=7054 RepID=A0A1Y1K8L3_PHOPY